MYTCVSIILLFHVCVHGQKQHVLYRVNTHLRGLSHVQLWMLFFIKILHTVQKLLNYIVMFCCPTEKTLVELRKITFSNLCVCVCFCLFCTLTKYESNFKKLFCGIIMYHAWLSTDTL